MISTEFKQNVESGDLVTVRSALVDYLIIDRTFKKFDESLEYACTSMNILQPFDNEPFETEMEKWDNIYLNQQKVALMVNISKERIEHIKSVIGKIMPVNVMTKTESELRRLNGSESHEGRTGRTIVAEKFVDSKKNNHAQNRNYQHKNAKPNLMSDAPQNFKRSTTGKTGRSVVHETPSGSRRSDEKNEVEDGIGTVMIVGGVAIATVGVITIEPVVIGAGTLVTGVGVGLKVRSRR